METLKTLEQYFKDKELPKGDIKVMPHETITDADKFVRNTISMLKANSGNRLFMPAFERLKQFKEYLEKWKNINY